MRHWVSLLAKYDIVWISHVFDWALAETFQYLYWSCGPPHQKCLIRLMLLASAKQISPLLQPTHPSPESAFAGEPIATAAVVARTIPEIDAARRRSILTVDPP